MANLASKHCVPCRGDMPPLTADQIAPLRAELHDDWHVHDNHHLERTFEFPDFAKALAFTNAVGAVAEAEGHHPDIYLAWGKVRITLWTHQNNGLTESDFVLAARVDKLPR